MIEKQSNRHYSSIMNMDKKQESQDNFHRARMKERIRKIIKALSLSLSDDELLSLDSVRSILPPSSSEVYQGIQAIVVEKIVGSEGRYGDFTRNFLPKHDFMLQRWANIDTAFLQDVILPPIQVYEINGYYFVRDGNHRISVARMQGIEMIDAEVIQLKLSIELPKTLTIDSLKKAIIAHERHEFLHEFPITDYIFEPIEFSNTGCYHELAHHIMMHKYFINQNLPEELSLAESIHAWFSDLYMPVLTVIRKELLLKFFPHSTETDLYLWIIKHWHYLKEEQGDSVSLGDAVYDYFKHFAHNKSYSLRSVITHIQKQYRKHFPPLELSWYVIVTNKGVFLHDEHTLPSLALDIHKIALLHIDTYNEKKVYAVMAHNVRAYTDFNMFREVYLGDLQLNETQYQWVVKGMQLMHWDMTVQYCSRCGSTVTMKKDTVGEFQKNCKDCGYISYPYLNPSVIVALIHHNHILLAHGKRHKPTRYSLIAGYINAGEIAEHAVVREIQEEVGIDISQAQIQYITNSNWPIPHALMLGFAAYIDNEIAFPIPVVVDGIEIVDAQWINLDDIRNNTVQHISLPPATTIAAKIITHCIR